MKVSLFTEIQCPSSKMPAALIENFLEQAEMADQLGFYGFWIAEIHFTPPFSVLSAPYVVLGAASQRTKRLRLGVAVNTLPIHHPVQLAEQAAILDLLTQGRMSFAAGGGHPHTRAYECFGIDHESARAMMEESVQVIRMAWSEEKVTFQGNFYSIPGVTVNPKPIQTPPPPIYTAASSLDGTDFAARMGLNLFLPIHTRTREQLREYASHYWARLEKAGYAPADHELGLLVPMYLDETTGRARDRAETGIMSYYEVIRDTRKRYTEWLLEKGAPLPSRLRKNAASDGLTFDRVCEEFAIVGTADAAVEGLTQLSEETGANHVLVWMNIGSMPHSLVTKSMERFARHVLPRLEK